MPTEFEISIVDVLEAVKDDAERGIPSFMISATLTDVRQTCFLISPIYWEGLARVHMTEGEIFQKKDWKRAHTAYTQALDVLTIFPFSVDTVDEQGPMIERALWERFVLAFKLGNHEDTVAAAKEALDGLNYATEYIDPDDGKPRWGLPCEASVHGWKRIVVRLYRVLSSPIFGSHEHPTTN